MTKHILLPFCSQRVQEEDSPEKINEPIWSCDFTEPFCLFFCTVILLGVEAASRCRADKQNVLWLTKFTKRAPLPPPLSSPVVTWPLGGIKTKVRHPQSG